jgi:lantibiotic transport system ATP-binding protein
MDSPALEVRNLSFGYGASATVRDVSLTVERGGCYGFLGHNGAGKTTVLRLCLGLLRPRAGSVRIGGVDALRDPRQARAQVGALVERPGFHLQATARQNLEWLARLSGMDRRKSSADADRVLALVGLSSSAARNVGSFSLGMRQRLGIAQSLLGSPSLLLLDEPINGLDPEGIADVRTLLRSLAAEQGVGVLLSSHQLQELEGLCTRVGVLREGAMALEGSLEDLRRSAAPRTIVRGGRLDAMASRLASLGIDCAREGEAIAFVLGSRAPGDIARELANCGELASFSPEPVTLESIYLRASRGEVEPFAVPAQPTTASDPPSNVTAAPDSASARAPRLRAFGHELRVLSARSGTRWLLCLPALVAAASVLSYGRRVDATQARVLAKELFSADAGSGFLAAAHALQAGIPTLALSLCAIGSNLVASDLQRDTLRNTLIRSVTRFDTVLGKALAMLVVSACGFAALVATATLAAYAAFGMGDLQEVTRNGDVETLAYAQDVAPAMLDALLASLPPLVAAALLAMAASAVAKKPARALLLAVAVVFGPEFVHSWFRSREGWVLTSHLPTPLRDDSAVAWFTSLARGAADANWTYEGLAVLCPAAWAAAAFVVAALAVLRLRIP